MKYVNEKMLFVFLLLFAALETNAQTRKIIFDESSEDFSNPERGFYISMEAKTSNYKPVDSVRLRELHAPRQMKGLDNRISVSLVMREILLDSFLHAPLSTHCLEQIGNDLSLIRAAGLKTILRFAYANRTHSGDCPDIYKICPPYGDAPKKIVLEHIRQLKPLLQKNADVIAVLQMGFIGVWGENYYTDYFGDASMNGLTKVMDSSWRDRNEVLKALLDALPKDRMVDVRTPQIKQRYVYGPDAPVSSAPLKPEEAFKGTDRSRIGFHNDCFLAGPDDYGTFYDYGNSSSPRGPANDVLRNYFINDSKYLPVGGETCDNTFSPENDCGPAGHAEAEMQAMHYSYLNSGYNMDVIKDWQKGGCLDSIIRKLGYRFVLRSVTLPVTIKKDHVLPFEMQLENRGFASPFNERPLLLVLRNKDSGKEYYLKCAADIRFWFSGSISCIENLQLPATLPAGQYLLLLSMPDKYASLAQRPAYSIRLANENVWEAATGYNKLNVSITVE